MSREAADPIARFVLEQSQAGAWPGGAWVVEEEGRVLSEGACGLAAREPAESPATPETIYDLASLTKPLATAALLGLLAEEGRIDPDEPASRWLGRLACAGPGERPTLRDLALHVSGLPPWRPLYAFAGSREEVLNRAVETVPDRPCGAEVVYSDLGYVLLGEAVSRAMDRPLDRLFDERIAGPSGLVDMVFRPAGARRSRCAPTERGNFFEIEKARGEGFPIDASRLRTELIQGDVHDGNSWALGGVAGHAGLFGTARETARLAREFVGGGAGLFGARAVRWFAQNATPGRREARTLGWKLALAGAPEAERVLSEAAFGHTGFTGTSVWIDPRSDRVYVLLTNRVHPSVLPLRMNDLRRRFHAVAVGLA